MLRYGFLPSDFNPMVLILGEAEDLARFAATLRDYAARPRRLGLAEAGHPAGADGTAVTLAPEGRPGMRRVAGFDLVWTLRPEEALAYAEQVEELAGPGSPAGSEMLGPDAENELQGLPVKVSRGEWRDDFIRG
jgi:hypothetical protein